jgi:pimeloyl-ACP methyl ester carboxylesterase
MTTMRILKLLKAAAIVAGACLTIAILSGAAYERVQRDRTARNFPAAGRLIDIGGRRMQIDCRGSGTPTVVFESGLGIYGSLSWAAVHDSIATTTRTCAYSRAGIMWSDPSGKPFDADSTAADLHTLLAKAGESAPLILVGHSLGGPYITTFAARYPDAVAGLVMVDATHPDQFELYEKAAGRSLIPPPSEAQLGATLAWTGLVRLLPQPPEPPSWPKVMRDSPAAFLPLSVRGLASEVTAIPATLDRARQTKSLGDRPLVVLCVSDATDPAELTANRLTAAQGARVHDAHLTLCRDMATWSTRGRFQAVERSQHYIQIDRPDAVIAAVREVMGYVVAHDSTPRRR